MEQFTVKHVHQLSRNGGICIEATAVSEDGKEVSVVKPMTMSDETFHETFSEGVVFTTDVNRKVYIDGKPTVFIRMLTRDEHMQQCEMFNK